MTEAEQDEIEALRQLDVGGAQRVDLLLGDRHPREESLAAQALVRVGIVGGHQPLVAPPDMPGGQSRSSSASRS